jgi:hypothetical protein
MIKSAFYSIVLRGKKVMKKRKFIEMNVILLLETWINDYLCFYLSLRKIRLFDCVYTRHSEINNPLQYRKQRWASQVIFDLTWSVFE